MPSDKILSMSLDFPLTPEIEREVNIICAFHGTGLGTLRKKKRCQGRYLKPYREIIFLLRDAEWSFTLIGDFLYRHHSAIIYQVRSR